MNQHFPMDINQTFSNHLYFDVSQVFGKQLEAKYISGELLKWKKII